jgi:hypothetical protein
VKKQIMKALSGLPGIRFNPSHDIEGDCGICLPFLFDDPGQAARFAELISCDRPINTGKHVYSAWTPVLEKRGAHIKGMNPYFSPKNMGLHMDYTKDSCPGTLDLLSRTVYLPINCDWTSAEVDEKIRLISDAIKRTH